MSRFFRYQARSVRVELEADRVRRAQRPQEAVGDPPSVDWQDPWQRTLQLSQLGMVVALEAVLREAVDAGILEANIELGAAFELENPRALTWIVEHAGEAIRGINATTEAEIRSVVADGVAAGASYDEVARAIADRLTSDATPKADAAIRSRAHLIAVTEMGNGYVQGNAMVGQSLQDAGLEMEKAWLTAEDDKVDELCAGNEADGWIPFDDQFSSGDDEPLAHPGCRCDLLQRAVGTASAGDSGGG